MLFHRVQQRRQLVLQIMLFLCFLYTVFQFHCSFVVPIVVINAILTIIVVICSSGGSSNSSSSYKYCLYAGYLQLHT